LLSNSKQLLIRYKAAVPAGSAVKYSNSAVINYTENGESKIESAIRNIYPESSATASLGVKSVDKTEISSDPSDQYVEYTLTFKTHSDSSYNMVPFEIGDIDLDDKLDTNVTFDHVSYTDSNFSVTYNSTTHSVHIENIKRIADSGTEHEVSFVVNFTNVPVGTTVSNSVGGNTVKTKKYGGGMSLTATKTVDGTIPGSNSYKFQLLDSNDKVLQTKTNDRNGLITFDQISYSKSDLGKTYTYTVKEVEGSDSATQYDSSLYTVKVTPTCPNDDGIIVATPVISKNGNNVNSIIFDNIVMTSVDVTKKWIGKSTDAVTVDLYADNVKTKYTIQLDSDNNWSGSFTDLYKYNNGNEITYTVKEENAPGYESTITGDQTTGFTITNKNIEKISIPVTKVWVGAAGTEAKVTLYADGAVKDTATLTAADNWKHTFTGLAKYNQTTGKEITYSITEDNVAGYTSSITGNQTKGFTVTNTDTETVSIPVTKVWIGAAGTEAKITLYADGAVKDTATLTAADNWKHTFTGLAKYNQTTGKEITYSITEDNITGYTSSVTGDQNNGFTVTNTDTETISIPVTKVWVGAAETEAKVTLYADGTVKDTATLTAADNWKHTFTGLAKYNQTTGKEITYSITEDNITGYTSSVTGDENNGFTVTNTDTETISIPVTKVWVGTAGTEAKVTLYADGAVKDTATITAADNWKHTFSNLLKFDQASGKEITYTLSEDNITGYASSVTGDQTRGFTVTNTDTETISIPVTKVWVGTAGTEAKVTLYADGVAKDTATLTAEDNWKHTFSNLLKFDQASGKEITYTLSEDNITGYASSVTGDQTKGFTVTNTNTETVSIPVTKVWIGAAGIEAKITLYADGVAKDTATLTTSDNWKHTFSNLLKFDQASGKEITYTLSEDDITGYTSSITGDQNNGFTVTNTDTETISIPVTKVWVGTAGTEAKVTLYADGVAKDTATLTAEDNWKHTFSNLFKFDQISGKEITYTLTEDGIAGYSSLITGDQTSGFEVTNTIDNVPVSSYTAVKSSDSEDKDVSSGDKITYYITLTNTGNTVLTGLWIRDYIPEYTHFISTDSLGELGAINGKQHVTWFVESMKPGEVIVLSMVVQIDDCLPDGCIIQNTAYTELTDNPKKPPKNSPNNPGTPTNNVIQKDVKIDTTVTYSNIHKMSSPKTGDNTKQTSIAFVLLLISFSAMIFLKKENKRKKDIHH
jgi:pilin isopeptide linkage protein/uncharacterized repeat protein (TIGR01451 family)